MSNYRRFAWVSLAFCVGVILWGAFVRATGSGAGCGDHWPLCNGAVLPKAERIQTAIEFGHRITSGISLLLVLALFVWTLRAFPKGSFQRKAAGYSLIAILIEALIGAAIVLLRLVEHDQSLDRAISIALHLVNTLFLVAALTITAVAPTVPNPRWRWPEGGTERRWARGLVILFGLVGGLGALTALGDTLFPVVSLSQELRDKFDSEARRHFLQNIRLFHPFLAVGWVGAAWLFLSALWIKVPSIKRLAVWMLWLAAGQLALGILNVGLLAPIWIQLVHLLWANVLWILFVMILFLAASEWRVTPFSGKS